MVAPCAKLAITPLVPTPQSTHVFGSPKFTRLNTFVATARNWRVERSVNVTFFSKAKSVLKNQGPRKEFRPTSPKCPGAGRCQAPDGSPGVYEIIPFVRDTDPGHSAVDGVFAPGHSIVVVGVK